MLKKVDEGMKIEINERMKKCRKINIENNKKGIERKNLINKKLSQKVSAKNNKMYCTSAEQQHLAVKACSFINLFVEKSYGRSVGRRKRDVLYLPSHFSKCTYFSSPLLTIVLSF